LCKCKIGFALFGQVHGFIRDCLMSSAFKS
jgi:hypothetical protein